VYEPFLFDIKFLISSKKTAKPQMPPHGGNSGEKALNVMPTSEPRIRSNLWFL